MKFLKEIDSNFFSLNGFSLEPDHWSLCLSNIQKLTGVIANYCKSNLNIEFPKDFVDVQGIARQGDKGHLLKLVNNFII